MKMYRIAVLGATGAVGQEMLRVLKPGGKLVILELSVPSNSLVRWFYKLYFLKILPENTTRKRVRFISNDYLDTLPEDWQDNEKREKLEESLKKFGAE